MGGTAKLDADQRHAARRSCQLQLRQHVEGSGIVWIGEVGDPHHGGDRLAQELQPLGAEVGAQHRIAGDIAAWAGEARHQAGTHWIGDADHYDRDRRCRRLGCFSWRRAVGRDQIDRAADKLAYDGREAAGNALAVAVLVDAAAFDVAVLAQRLAKAMPHRRVINDSDARYTRWLLRPSGPRPRRRPANER